MQKTNSILQSNITPDCVIFIIHNNHVAIPSLGMSFLASVTAYQGLCCTHFTLLVSILQPQCVHGTHDSSQRLDGVAVDHWLVLLHVITRETILVDNPAHTQRKNVRE